MSTPTTASAASTAPAAASKKTWRIKLWVCIAGIIIIPLIVWAFCPSAPEATGIASANSNTSPPPRPLRVYTQDIMMVTETTNVLTPFGYSVNVNWGYAPIHNANIGSVKDAPGHTQCDIGEEQIFEFNPGYEVKPVKLHCTYTELKQES